MKTNVLFTTAVCCAMLVPSLTAKAQDDAVVVEEEQTTVISDITCKDQYYVNKKDNWFIQFGAGIAIPFLEGTNKNGDRESHITVNYNFGFGKWFSPYMGWRASFMGGPLHYENKGMSKFKYVSANVDFMWDMFNSLGGVNPDRVFSIIPFIGLGGTYAWDFKGPENVYADNRVKTNSWTLPVSGGIQLRFRLCKYVDFFAEGRAQFYGDNFNNIAFGRPVDINGTVTGGFTITFGGRDYKSYNPCEYVEYIDNLNNQVNSMRAALAASTAALAAAEAQLPCPEVVESETVAVEVAPMMATVRFTLNSARISDQEKVNVFNTAEWMKANPDQNVAIVGYADKDTGTSDYNMTLSKRRAKAVYDMLVNEYGINPDRLVIQAEGSNVQPYDVNNWNRIVIFNAQ
ncbi:MAG: OmpA family protein [Muribaculaceae bacterium]|nr:OmpA family protein [Muribaculaceae bacterium]